MLHLGFIHYIQDLYRPFEVAANIDPVNFDGILFRFHSVHLNQYLIPKIKIIHNPRNTKKTILTPPLLLHEIPVQDNFGGHIAG